jgi:hypothetical protein
MKASGWPDHGHISRDGDTCISAMDRGSMRGRLTIFGDALVSKAAEADPAIDRIFGGKRSNGEGLLDMFVAS